MKKLPDIKSDFAQWYQDVVHEAELAENAPVRGCFVIRPYGYAMWENIQAILDKKLKATGHENAAFPLLIPQSFLEMEAKHVEGFSPELAVVTHAGGKQLEEPLVVRPTSETIIHASFARWIKSWRDLPLKINQWANVMRWEMRPRAFLRTSEFFWQEGHTAHATQDNAWDEMNTILKEYIDLIENHLAIPVITGKKSEHEKFPGAEVTITMEGLMQDGRALQMGTVHLLSQSFARAFNISFQDQNGTLSHPFLTSWAVTTRLIGAMIMTHGDKNGLVMPPKIAPIQIVIIPITKKDADNSAILAAVYSLANQLQATYRVKIDDSEHQSPGAKFFKWDLKGVPLRLELGPRDLENNSITMVNRMTGEKKVIALDAAAATVSVTLDAIQRAMLEQARQNVKQHWHKEAKLADFGPRLEQDAGMYQTGWCQNPVCEQELKKYKATTRCLLDEHTQTTCFHCNQPSKQDVLVAKSY